MHVQATASHLILASFTLYHMLHSVGKYTWYSHKTLQTTRYRHNNTSQFHWQNMTLRATWQQIYLKPLISLLPKIAAEDTLRPSQHMFSNVFLFFFPLNNLLNFFRKKCLANLGITELLQISNTVVGFKNIIRST